MNDELGDDDPIYPFDDWYYDRVYSYPGEICGENWDDDVDEDFEEIESSDA